LLLSLGLEAFQGFLDLGHGERLRKAEVRAFFGSVFLEIPIVVSKLAVAPFQCGSQALLLGDLDPSSTVGL
jgi:hypothetical protein